VLAAAEGVSPARLSLAWLLGRRPFVVPIPGTRQARWLDDDLAAAELAPRAATTEALDRLFAPDAVAGARYSEAERRRVEL
jgi:aryl-alcohol dehydrogenase-like predicted oxidoreductase